MDIQGSGDKIKSYADTWHRLYVPNPTLSEDTYDLGDSFSVVSYNILAECHRVRWDYSYTAEEFLCQEYRHNLLMKELQYLNGDVVCLQEVNPEYFKDILLPAMEKLGYSGLMKCRTQDYYDEGGATFYKTDVFQLESSKGVSLTDSAYDEVRKTSLDSDVKTALLDYLDQADVLLITHLRCKKSDRIVTIGNVHLWWDENLHPDVKTLQAACAVKEVVSAAGCGGAYMICGDYNSNWFSPVYQLMTDGHLSNDSMKTLQNVQKLAVSDGFSKSLVDHIQISHSAKNLKSAYAAVLGAEPEITCYTGEEWMLDYIFYDSKTLVPTGVLNHADKDTIVGNGGLPSEDFPSDHLSLKAVVAFVQWCNNTLASYLHHINWVLHRKVIPRGCLNAYT